MLLIDVSRVKKRLKVVIRHIAYSDASIVEVFKKAKGPSLGTAGYKWGYCENLALNTSV